MPKRKRHSEESSEDIRKKIKKLELKLQRNTKRHNRLIVYSDSENEGSDSDASSASSDRNILRGLLSIPNTTQVTAASATTPATIDTPSTSDPGKSSSGPQEETVPELDSEILEALGDAPKSEIKLGKPTHKDLATRWQEILEKGLAKEVKEKLLDSYRIPENCDLLVGPSLNPEVKAALADSLVKRDNAILAKQKQISVAIAALNQAAELIIAKEQHTRILKPISDACRLLCDSHYSDTKTRRGFVISAINPDMKDALSETKRDKLLFGENVSDKLKSAKTIKRSGADLKQAKTYRSSKFNINNFVKSDRHQGNSRLNWRTMPRKITPKVDYRKTRQQQRSGPHNGSQRRETTERAAAATRSSRRR